MVREDNRIIGLCGRAFSGKTALANFLVEKYGYERVYVAQALKELCSDLCHMSIDEMNARKNEEIHFVLNDTDMHLISERTSIPFEVIKEELAKIGFTLKSTRQAFQFIGTELIRKYNPNWHIEMMLSTMKPDKKYVVDDVRFPNEVEALNYHGSVLIFVIRPQLDIVSHHRSEESIKWSEFDHIIINNDLTLEYAEHQLINIVEHGISSIADAFIEDYDPNWLDDMPNFDFKVEKKGKFTHIHKIDKASNKCIKTYNQLLNPLEFEDFKFKYNEKEKEETIPS